MKTASVLIVLGCVVAFGGCVLKGPEFRVKPPIEVNVEGNGDWDGDRGRGGRFCPPGLAKQGRC